MSRSNSTGHGESMVVVWPAKACSSCENQPAGTGNYFFADWLIKNINHRFKTKPFIIFIAPKINTNEMPVQPESKNIMH